MHCNVTLNNSSAYLFVSPQLTVGGVLQRLQRGLQRVSVCREPRHLLPQLLQLPVQTSRTRLAS